MCDREWRLDHQDDVWWMLVLFYHLSYHLVATNSGTTRCLYKIKLINISQRRQILCFYSNLNIKYLELCISIGKKVCWVKYDFGILNILNYTFTKLMKTFTKHFNSIIDFSHLLWCLSDNSSTIFLSVWWEIVIKSQLQCDI